MTTKRRIRLTSSLPGDTVKEESDTNYVFTFKRERCRASQTDATGFYLNKPSIYFQFNTELNCFKEVVLLEGPVEDYCAADITRLH